MLVLACLLWTAPAACADEAKEISPMCDYSGSARSVRIDKILDRNYKTFDRIRAG